MKEIRELYGVVAGERASRGVFITSGEYTPDARAFAVGKPLDLVDGAALLGLVREVQRVPAPTPAGRVEPAPSPAPSAAPAHSAAVPSCPVCGGSMVLRTAKRGGNAGGRFWGCSGYPRCRGVVEAGRG